MQPQKKLSSNTSSPVKDQSQTKGGLILQKQMPASSVPRFNPHGAQPLPQPKPQEYQAYSPIKKQFGKKKVVTEKDLTDFSSFNIEDLLLSEGVEFRNSEKAQGGWLPLEAYDDKEYDTKKPQDWLKSGSVSQADLKQHQSASSPAAIAQNRDGVGAQGLWKDKDGLCYWRKLRVLKFLPKSERYEGYWENTKEKCRLNRIFILFDEEDPRIFVRRFKQAYANRIFADSLIKYNYYIENMPTHQIPEIDNEKVNRILSSTQNSKALRGKSSSDTTTLLSEVNFDFAKTMNKIIFDKHLKEKGNELITGNLRLPPKPAPKLSPFYGMINIPPHNFPEQFSQFCFNTLQNKDEVIKAQQDIRKECNDVFTKDIYNPNITKTMRIDEFKQIQASSISQTSYYLRETWVNKIKDIIKTNFQESSATGKSWFNLNETSKETYEMGKLKKFLTQVKFTMQDTLLYMTQKSVGRFVESIMKYLPISVKVIDSNTVENIFFSIEEQQKNEIMKQPQPLFAIDLMLSEDNQPMFSTSPNDVVVTLMLIFDNGLKALQEISQPEQKLLPHLFKTNMKMFLKATVRPDFKPDEPEANDKKTMPDENAWVYDGYFRLRENLEKAIKPLDQYIHTYDKYDKEYKLDPEAYIKKLDDEDNPPEIDFLKKDVLFHQQEAERLKKEIPDFIIVSIFKVSCREIRSTLAQKHEKIAEDEIELIAKQAKQKANELIEGFDKMIMKIESQPKDVEELTSIKDYMASVPSEIEKMNAEIKNCMNIYDILGQFGYKYADDEDYDKKWRVFGAPKDTVEKIDKQHAYLEKEKEKFLQQMIGNQTEFLAQITELENLVTSFQQYQDINQYEDVASMTRTIHARLQNANEQAKVFNNREMLTGQPDTDYSQIQLMVKDFNPYFNLWTTVDNWRKSHKSWLHDEFSTLDAPMMEETVDGSNKTMAQVIRYFREKDLPGILKIGEMIKAEVDEFKPFVPLAMALRTEGMKERHWETVSEKVGFEVKPYEGFTFNHCLEMELAKFSEELVDIGERAGKEYNIEQTLLKMKKDWETIEFNLVAFKNTGTFSVTGFDDAMAMLDEHIVLTQTMQFSPFKKPFEEEIETWNASLLYVSECIDEWIKCQGQWMYLQPIFDSPDIMKQLPSENKKFKNVDKVWRECIIGTRACPNVLKSCTREGLLEKFQDANKNLDLVQRGLKEYLEQKRSIFARFYFLSNDELLEILSQTKEVENVRPHLRKVFENMADLEFKPDKTIIAMYSGEKEKINFVDVVDPRDKGVEFWMGEVERMMFKSVRWSLKNSVDDYVTKPRPDWILVHPGQCVLNGSQVHWTTEVEEGMLKEGKVGVAKYYTQLDMQLQDTVKLVRKKLTKLQSITLGALIVIDVHAKDVVDNLRVCQIEDTNAFEWISQLRYYWEDDNCRVKCIQTNFPYGYEYLGNTQRLVITPLTDKCYMTLMGALKLNLGGAPAGPAGTGKTESTKDLAKALAKQCVVFNCSDGMDYIMIGKFFKGLASAGAWACFDEFNRINIEVLSVIAQQLLQLFGAKGRGEEELIFEESTIKLQASFCVFITMNPGYAGRTELPDNLKALFRPVAMMVPDYALIGQIMLYSFGFTCAAILAKKMVTTFKLCSEQLSSQDHYDYGMRAVRSVINAAGLLKRQDPDMNEDQLLLRALRDVNVPKFLKDDLPLFEGIMSDLFPGVQRPNIDYGQLLDQIKKSCAHYNVQPVEPFLDKIIQLYDTTQVRHGLMIVGPTGGGKTMNYKTLAHAMTQLQHNENFAIVHYHILNPKSITMGQLYGEFDPQTTEWIDGVLAKMVSDCARDESPDRHWIMFDGPVDALWIENMNTVLDDNKKLCLNSGQIITLTDRMTMMFEVEDLAVASPATVSRCGMVYMEPGAIGLDPLIKSWLHTTPLAFKHKKSFLPNLEGYFKKYLNEMLKFMRRNCIEPVPTVNNNITQSLMRILDCYFAEYWDTELRKIAPEEVEELEQILEPLFVFSLVWSIGCTTNLDGREKFDKRIRELIGNDAKYKFPATGQVYDYCFEKSGKEWKIWTDTVPAYSVDNKLSYGEIVVPTFDSIRMKYLKKMLVMNKKHVLSPGPTGTGKTVNINELLTQQLPEEYQSIPLTFSAQTSANQSQDALDEKFEKRRKGVYGPSPGKRFVIFVDDLNMPKKEEYGAQPPIELLRQWMDHGGWYDRKSKEKNFMKIEDIIFICAMGPPGGGRSPITKRLERHFNIITYTNLGKDSIKMIFSQIVKAFLSVFSEQIASCLDNIVESTQKVYNAVATNLKPTPSKSHYTFNLRDMSKIFQGLCSANAKQTTQVVDLIRLWIHENQRVFGDRMISNQDRDVLDELLHEEVTSVFGLTKEQVYITQRIIFGDYLGGIDIENRPYVIVQDLKDMVRKIEGYLEDYNAGTKHPMKLVMFLDACDHVSRICRILRQPQGNALLLGVGGSGRQSLSRLASYISNYKCYQIEVVKGYNMVMWRENLKTCLMQAGVDGKPTTFLFCDTQIINEQMLEDINNVLNSGDVPGLYKTEDFEGIFNIGKAECLRRGITLNKMNMFSCYLARVKQNIHIVLAMSPLGEIFRTRLRKFPSLVNCCTIDWFTEWPEEALLNVARGCIADTDLNLAKDEAACVEMFKIMHQSVEIKSQKFLDELRRRNYVTPTSYLELLNMYKSILTERRKYFGDAKTRLEKGLNVLYDAAIEVANLREMLEKKKPVLQKTQIEVEKTKKIIEKESAEAAETKKIVAEEEAEAATQEAEVSKIKSDADRDLSVALPALENAVKQVKNINVNDFYELKSVNTPLPAIVQCFMIVCFMLQLPKPKKQNDPKKMQYDPEGYFELSKQKLLSDPKKFLQDLINYDKDHIPDALVAKVKPLMEKEEMSEKKVASASGALVAVRVWVEAMIQYHEVLKIVNPKRAIAQEMGAKLDVVQANLNEKRRKVKEINDMLEALQKQMDELIRQEKSLLFEIEDCGKKLIRAEKMITGLEGEKVRWTDTVKALGERQTLLVGDCLIASGMVSYAGPFTAQYRLELEEEWRENIKRLGVKMTPMVTMRGVLGDDVTIRQWSVAGLPNDNLSIENGIIMFKSRRWPLMIDPQTQANKFVKNMGKEIETGLDVFKLSDSTLLRNLEMAIQFGKWVLVENIGEELDPALEPILLQQKVRSGSGYVIKIGEKTISYSDSFKFFLTTTLPNPHYTPETSVKVTLLNFAITPQGLEEQMLNLLVLLELPELQEKKNQIVEDNAKAAKELRDIEDRILHGLTKNENIAQILEDDELINILAESKKTSEQISIRMKESEITEKEIDTTRESFRPVAYRASLLFFCIVDLAIIDPMYQYSLQWFQILFSKAVENSMPSNDVTERIQSLNNYFTLSLYQNVCRSLFEKHKLLFSFLLTAKILFGSNLIDPAEWRFFLAGPSGSIEMIQNPTDWLDDLEWTQVYRQLYVMSLLPAFRGMDTYFIEFNKKFKKIFDSPEAHEEPMPGEWNDKLNSFQKMIMLKAIRADKMSQAIQNYIIEKIGKEFIDPPTFKIEPCYKDSSALTPLIFVLSTGSDPVADFKKFSEEMDMLRSRTEMISLGQGQDKKAERMIDEAKGKGGWVLLQNCHLALSWMPKLEIIVENLSNNVHADFRMWLTSMPNEKFPVSTLQNSVKMTLEPPQGLRANLKRTYDLLDNKTLNDCKKPREFKKLLFGFAFFHAIVQDRRKFGPIGWNIPYAFTFEDFDVCKKQLKIFLDDYEVIPYKVLNYLGAEINYGGRVTDDKDVRLIKCILSRYIADGMIEDGFKFSESGLYNSIKEGTQEEYINYINQLPFNPHPEAFGLHENAEITTNQSETRRTLEDVLSIQPRTSSAGGKTREQVIMEISIDIESKTPPAFDLEMVIEKYPTEYTESMNTVLTQEVLRYNKLLTMMADMLFNVQKAVKGEIVMSEDLEKMSSSLFDNMVPNKWAEVGFLSQKPLASWVQDLNQRVKFLKDWIEGGTPPVYWISGFFFPQAFFTGTLQNYARKHVIAIDELDFEFKIYDEITPQEVTEKPEDGCFIYGVYLEGARWDSNEHILNDSKPKQLYTELPMCWFLPKKNRKKPETGIYNCPVYKVLSRSGTLSTTGHSTNYVLMIELPSKATEEKWIAAGVAAFLALRY